jgi:cytochrome c-type biogenesis protein CcmH/NrfG
MDVFRGNVLLMRGDTTTAAEAYREAVRRDSSNAEARLRLQAYQQSPDGIPDRERSRRRMALDARDTA